MHQIFLANHKSYFLEFVESESSFSVNYHIHQTWVAGIIIFGNLLWVYLCFELSCSGDINAKNADVGMGMWHLVSKIQRMDIITAFLLIIEERVSLCTLVLWFLLQTFYLKCFTCVFLPKKRRNNLSLLFSSCTLH